MVFIDSHFWTSSVDIDLGCFKTPQKDYNYGYITRHGYAIISLTKKDGTKQTVRVNRAIWMAANRKVIPAGLQCMHLNDIRSDNRIQNLMLGTPSENTLQSIPNRKKTRNRSGYRYTCYSLDEDTGETQKFDSVTKLAHSLGVSSSTAAKCYRGEKYYRFAHHKSGKKYRILKPDAFMALELAPKCKGSAKDETIIKPGKLEGVEKHVSVQIL